jgi:hypothetical protein
MIKFLAGVVVGIVVSAVGFGGIARMLDRGDENIQSQTRDLAR